MKDSEKEGYQPKRSLGKSPTELLERTRPQSKPEDVMGEERLKLEAADQESEEGSGEDQSASAGEVQEEDIPTKQIPKRGEEPRKKEGYPQWEEDKPGDAEPDESQPGSSATEADQT